MKIKLLIVSIALCSVPAAGQTTEKPDIVEALERLKVTGYIQAQYARDQFSVRRGRVKFTYRATQTSRFVLQPDFSSSGVTLKDAYVELTEPWTGWANTLTAGQFTWPFGFELPYSSSNREMPERSLVVRTLFPGERDRGVMLSGAGLSERFDYRVAVVNGTGTSQSSDSNKRKDLVGGVGYSFGPVDVGASIYRGAELVSGREFDKQRSGVDFQWTTPLPGLRVRGEYIRGVQPPPQGVPVSSARSSDVEGWYVYAIQNAGKRHQFVVRADEYDPDTSWDDDDTLTIGGSYIFRWDTNSKVMVAYDDAWTIRYQYSF